jgi:voltage-gated potassium channel
MLPVEPGSSKHAFGSAMTSTSTNSTTPDSTSTSTSTSDSTSDSTSESAAPERSAQHSEAYNLFILVITVLSLVIMVLLLLPLDEQTLILLRFYDNTICVVFLVDFALQMRRAPSKRGYFIHQRGWLDLLGSIPSLGFFQAAALFRLARLSRLARVMRLLREHNKDTILNDVLHNRAQYAFLITVLAALLVLISASIVVLEAESRAPGANITTGGDALWWAIVTITTVGYGDKYPITAVGRSAAVFVMVAGIGIIGSLASIMASFLVAPPPSTPESTPTETPSVPDARLAALEVELRSTRTELAAVRALLERAADSSSPR